MLATWTRLGANSVRPPALYYFSPFFLKKCNFSLGKIAPGAAASCGGGESNEEVEIFLWVELISNLLVNQSTFADGEKMQFSSRLKIYIHTTSLSQRL